MTARGRSFGSHGLWLFKRMQKKSQSSVNMASLLLASLVLIGLLGSVGGASFPVPGPYHAFCRVMWLFAPPCSEVGSQLVQQIQAWDVQYGCDECRYTLISASNQSIKASHVSDLLNAENVTFTLSPTILTGGCRMSGLSVSQGFTSLLDDGLNYCNLYNLVSASGLSQTPGFMESTNEWACLGLGMATCNVF